jgi:hypothetical protein
LLAADWSPPTPWQTATGIVEIWTKHWTSPLAFLSSIGRKTEFIV